MKQNIYILEVEKYLSVYYEGWCEMRNGFETRRLIRSNINLYVLGFANIFIFISLSLCNVCLKKINVTS